MQSDEIKPSEIYRLNDGRIVRIMTVFNGMARCDVFETRLRKWIQLDHAVPLWIFKEKYPDPTKS